MLDAATFQMQLLICRLTGSFPPASEADALNYTALVALAAVAAIIVRRPGASR